MTDRRQVSALSELVPTRHSLLERLRNLEDQASWQEFFDTYWKLIYCAAVKSGLSDAEAEEVVQETVIAVARKMGTFRYDPKVCSFKGWLMLLTRCRIVDQVRKRRPNQRPLPLPRADTDTTTEATLKVIDPAADLALEHIWDEEWEKNLIDAAMERVKRKVNAQHYQIFHLHAVKNMAARDIGRLLGVSTAKVYVVRHRVGCLVKREVQRLEQRQGGER